MSKQFKVNPQWLDACGMNPDSPPFKVIAEEQTQHMNGQVFSWLTLDCGTHTWLCDSRRGRFVDSNEDK